MTPPAGSNWSNSCAASRLGHDLSLADGPRRFDIHDDAELHVDQVVVGVGKERGPSHRTRPLCGRIGRWDKLRGHLARRTEGRVVEGCPVFLHHPARRLRITILDPVFAWHLT